MTSVSIIICTRNRADSLKPSLESLGQLDIPSNYSAELIVVDNGSTDGTAQLLQTLRLPNLPLHYINEGRRGKSNCLNTALAVAQGEIILWTDDDVRVPKDWISGMCQPIEKGEADVTAGEVSLAPNLERDWMTQFHRASLGETRTLPKDRLPFGVNMAFHRRVLKAVPSLDTDLGPGALGSGEEILFALQLKEAGFRIVAAPSVIEHHFDPSRLLYPAWKKRGWVEGRIEAYWCYHWFHGQVPFASLRAQIKTLQLIWFRLSHGHFAENEEGCAEEEVYLIKYLEFFRGYAKEAKRPRNYELKGLIRRH
jgi:glucosyl-dolichyl phosphate glucuronosyltransferase